MRILFLCHRFPYPPQGGAKIRAFYMIRHLGESHEVTVASLVRSEAEAEQGQGLEQHCHRYIAERVTGTSAAARMVARLASRDPSSFGYFWSPRLARRVRDEVATGKFDLIVVHCSSMAPYVRDVRGVPKVLDFCDMDSQKWLAYGSFKPFPLSAGYYLEALKLQLAEAELASRFDICTCATHAELRTLDGLNADTRTDWFPNGVDTERFKPDGEAYDPDIIAFVGRMDYYPNEECMVEFCTTAFPLIRAERPSARLVIVGADPTRAVRALGRIDGVTVTGSVAEVQPYILRSALTVAPLNIARGVQNKILESMSMGVPVVCSALAAGGVDAVPGEHLLVARSARDYASAVLRLLQNPDERSRLARAGRARIESHHTWQHAMTRFDSIVERALDGDDISGDRHRPNRPAIAGGRR